MNDDALGPLAWGGFATHARAITQAHRFSKAAGCRYVVRRTAAEQWLVYPMIWRGPFVDAMLRAVPRG